MCLSFKEMALFSNAYWSDERKELAMSCLREEALDRMACVFAELQKNNVHVHDEQLAQLKRHFSLADITKLFDLLLADADIRALPLYNVLVSYEAEIARMIQDLNKKFS